jgi:hypothetical protein
MRNLRFATFCAVALFASPALAEPDNAIWIGPTNRALRTTSADAVTKDSLVGGELGYSRALGMTLPHGLALAADATFDWGGADGTMFQSITTRLDTLSMMVGGRLRYPVHNRVVATARLGIGMARAALDIHDADSHTATDHGWGATSMASLAVDLRAYAGPDFSLGVRFELGYVGAAPITMRGNAPHSADTLTLMMDSASLGSLNLSGPVFAVSAVTEL